MASGWKRKSMAANLHQLRTKAGLSQARLAALLGVTPNTVARWERGEREPPPYLTAAVIHVTVCCPASALRFQKPS